ncbi:MAG TPA: TetR/AcrR family transcriptional regulator [Roseiflexaceae bacterium]|jgi:AcrR family transcriptional regulator|nr:TetR/AcrR family transcriptional regulator [Roseiflexaceae bacterium]
MPRGIPLTEQEQAQRRREIFDASVKLFLEKGFPETSMREIAEAAGMGKSSLYDYFRTKDEILAFVIEEETAILTQQAQAIARQSFPPEARLKRVMETHFTFMQENRNLFSRLSAEALRLKAESQRGIQQRRYAYQDLVAGIIQEGISQGRFRAVDPLNAARLLLNSLLSVLYTTRPTASAEAMLEEAVDIFLRGITR